MFRKSVTVVRGGGEAVLAVGGLERAWPQGCSVRGRGRVLGGARALWWWPRGESFGGRGSVLWWPRGELWWPRGRAMVAARRELGGREGVLWWPRGESFEGESFGGREGESFGDREARALAAARESLGGRELFGGGRELFGGVAVPTMLTHPRFVPKENIAGLTQVKSSVQRNIRAAVLEQYPFFEDHIEAIMPKKTPVFTGRVDRNQIVIVNSEIVFFSDRDGHYYPSLYVLHQYPGALPEMRVDKGAIKFVMAGANVMCPGLTHPNASMADVEKGVPVAIMAEGKDTAMAVGITLMSTAEIRDQNKGIGIEVHHYLNDGLWKHRKID